MHQLDLYIFLFLFISIIIGAVRGFSGELGSLLKLTLTIFISYKILDIINDKLDIPILQNVFFPAIMYTVVYIVTSFILKIIIYQMVFLLRSATPPIIDKPFGVILGFSKALLILTMLYIITATAIFTLKIETPKWLQNTFTQRYCTSLSLQFLRLIPNIEYDKHNIGDNSLLLNMSPLPSHKKDDKESPTIPNILPSNLQDSKILKDPEVLKGVLTILKHRKAMEKLDDPNTEIDEYSMDELIESLEDN